MTPGGGSAADTAAAVHAVRVAAEADDRGTVSVLLAPAVAMVTDSGLALPAGRSTVRGRSVVAEQLCVVLRHEHTVIAEQNVNGQAGLVLRRAGRIVGVVSVNVRDHLITDLWVVVNRDKLRHWNRAAD